MTIADNDPFAFRLACAAGVLVTVTSISAQAETWQIEPSITVEERWTDNALSTPNDRHSDFITTVAPTLVANGKGKRVDVGLDYSLAYDRYAAQNDLDGLRHKGLVTANAEVLEDLFFVDARGNISEQMISPAGASTADDRTAASNRTRVATYSLTPELRHRLGSWAIVQTSYRYDRTSYLSTGSGSNTDTGLADSIGSSGKAQVRSGEEFSRVLWSYQVENINRRSGSTFIQTSHTANGEYRFAREWGLLSHVGHDYLNGETLASDDYSGVFYGGGVHWNPSPRTDVRAEVGQRYHALDVFVLGTQQLGTRTTLNLSHQTSISSDAQSIANALETVKRDEFGRFIDPFSGLSADPAGSLFQRTDALFKTTESRIAVANTQDRDVYRLFGTLSTREATAPTTVQSTDTTALAVGVAWSHQLTETVTGTASVTQSGIIDAARDEGKSRRVIAMLDLAYQLNPSLAGHASYSYADTQPEKGAGVTENLFSVGLRKKF